MKKALTFLLAAVLLFSLTACSHSELNFYNTMKSLASLDTYSFDGTMNVDVKKLELLDANASQASKQQVEMIKAMFAGKDYVYSGSVDSKNQTLAFHMAVKSSDGQTSDLLDIQAKNKYRMIQLPYKRICFIRELLSSLF